MTIEDAFDARLRAAFAAAQPEPNEAFVERIVASLGGKDRRRLLIIGGAGASGSTIASMQLEQLFQYVRDTTGAFAGLQDGGAGLLVLLQPETLAAVTLAAMVAAFACFLPSRR